MVLFLLLGLVCEVYEIGVIVDGDRASAWEMMEWHILTHSSIGNCGSVWCDDREGYEVRMTHLKRNDAESYVKEERRDNEKERE